MEMVMG